ncbi:TPA: hypothetical protein NPM51_001555 [Enterobacter hormaechei]|nr:hypothetical protein [Enterobacter hormaechei]HEM8782305.1 hypothetical protein [Enterobacter hormaechei]
MTQKEISSSYISFLRVNIFMGLILSDIAATGNTTSMVGAVNANFQKIEDAINKSLLHRNGDLGVAGGNQMSRPLDMNGQSLANGSFGDNVTLMGYKVADLVSWSAGSKQFSENAQDYALASYQYCDDAHGYAADANTALVATQTIRDSLQPQYNALSSSVSTVAAEVSGKAGKGANSDITSLSGLTTPLSVAQGGIGVNSYASLLAALAISSGTGSLKVGNVQAYFGTATVTAGVVTIVPPAAITITAALAIPVTASAVAAQYFSYDSSSTSTSVKFRSSNASGTGNVMYLILGVPA